MHLWPGKRSCHARNPLASSATWSATWSAAQTPPKRTHDTCAPMPAPVHRYPPVPTAQREASRRLAEQRRPSTNGEPSRQLAGRTASNSESSRHPELSELEADILLDEMTDDLDCDPAKKCQSCCCIVVVTVLVIFTLSLAKMYIGHGVRDEQKELTGIIFLVMLLFFAFLLLFFVRFSVLVFRTRALRSADAASGGEPDCAEAAPRPADSAHPAGASEPPPYNEAVLLPAPAIESPPPSYDKLQMLMRS